METEATIYSYEGEEIDAYFYATDDIEYVLVESAERAWDEYGEQVFRIDAHPLNDYENVLGIWQNGEIEIY